MDCRTGQGFVYGACGGSLLLRDQELADAAGFRQDVAARRRSRCSHYNHGYHSRSPASAPAPASHPPYASTEGRGNHPLPAGRAGARDLPALWHQQAAGHRPPQYPWHPPSAARPERRAEVLGRSALSRRPILCRHRPPRTLRTAGQGTAGVPQRSQPRRERERSPHRRPRRGACTADPAGLPGVRDRQLDGTDVGRPSQQSRPHRPTNSPQTGHPVSVERLQKLLRHPYYKGVVTFQGVEYAGQHEPLVDAATWQTVQDILAAHTNGERQRMHTHHLKSTIVCSFCGARRRLLRLLRRVGDGAVLWDFCVRALEEARVALTPGARLRGGGGRHARVPVLHGQPGGDRPRS